MPEQRVAGVAKTTVSHGTEALAWRAPNETVQLTLLNAEGQEEILASQFSYISEDVLRSGKIDAMNRFRARTDIDGSCQLKPGTASAKTQPSGTAEYVNESCSCLSHGVTKSNWN